MTLRTTATALVAIALLCIPATAGAAGKGSKPVVREFTGTVSAVKGKSFTLRRSGRPGVVVKLARKTRVAKGAKPRKGGRLVVKARRVKKAWVARSVRLVPVAAEEDEDEFADEEPLDEPPVADEGEEGEPEPESEPVLDLEDPFDDFLPDGEE